LSINCGRPRGVGLIKPPPWWFIHLVIFYRMLYIYFIILLLFIFIVQGLFHEEFLSKLFLILVLTWQTSDLSFSKISSNLYLILVLRCFVECNFDLTFFYEKIKTKNFLRFFVERGPVSYVLIDVYNNHIFKCINILILILYLL